MTAPSKPLCIGVSVYNGERYLGPAIESLLVQMFDNAPMDGTEEICRAAARRDRRIDYPDSASRAA